MAKLNVQQIRELAKLIVCEHPSGILYSELVRLISERNPETPINTIHGSVWNLDTRLPTLIHKPSWGLFQPLQSLSAVNTSDTPTLKLPREEEFYAPFAAWLKNELDEVTVAVPMGGAGF
jgi:hypothetical protein